MYRSPLFLRFRFQGKKVWLPESSNEFFDGCKPGVPHGVHAACPFFACFDQTSTVEHGEVLGYGLLRNVHRGGDVTHRARPFPQ
jgi:hypothetical protein